MADRFLKYLNSDTSIHSKGVVFRRKQLSAAPIVIEDDNTDTDDDVKEISNPYVNRLMPKG